MFDANWETVEIAPSTGFLFDPVCDATFDPRRDDDYEDEDEYDYYDDEDDYEEDGSDWEDESDDYEYDDEDLDP